MWWVAQWIERLNILIHPLPEKADESRVIACQAGGRGFDSRSTTPNLVLKFLIFNFYVAGSSEVER